MEMTEFAELIDSGEVSRILGVKIQTLSAWRFYGRDLPYVKCGRLIRYRRQDVAAFIERHRVGGS